MLLLLLLAPCSCHCVPYAAEVLHRDDKGAGAGVEQAVDGVVQQLCCLVIMRLQTWQRLQENNIAAGREQFCSSFQFQFSSHGGFKQG